MKSGRLNGSLGSCIPPIGKIPSWSPKNQRAARPSRNDGVETPRNAKPVSAKSSFEYWRSAEMIPSGMPIAIPMKSAVSMSDAEASSPRFSMSAMGSPPTGGVSEIALQGLGQPAHVAHGDRLVEAVPLDDDLAHRLVVGELRPDERRDRVARRDAQGRRRRGS